MGVWESLAVAFLGALVAFVLGHLGVRLWHRRTAIEQAALTLGTDMTAFLLEHAEGGPDWRSHSAQERFQRLLTNLSLMRRTARRPMARARDVHREASDLLARVGAIRMQVSTGGPLLTDEELELIETKPLLRAVFGDSVSIDDQVEWYRQHGFTRRYPGTNA